MKSAFNRFFNRGGRDQDAYTVDLGVFAEGRPRLAVGASGFVLPLFDEQHSTIIAYSLSSVEYEKQFKQFSKNDSAVPEGEPLEPGESILPTSDGTSQYGKGTEGRKASTADGPPKSVASDEARLDEIKDIERRMLVRSKHHIKHTFRDVDDKGHITCKFVCTSYWATQFQAVRQVFLSQSSTGKLDPSQYLMSEVEQCYVESLSSAYVWNASGGKSGASFSRTSDDRFVIKCISRTELQMFLDCAPAYFEYLSKAFFHGL